MAQQGADPITYEYDLLRRGHVTFEVPLAEARGFNPICLRFAQGLHPFVDALRAASEADQVDRIEVINRELSVYYDTVQPKDALEVVDLASSEAPGLAGAEAIFYRLPWSASSLEEIKLVRHRTAVFEGLESGASGGAIQGLTNFGPANENKIKMEASRLASLLASFATRGFQGHVRGNPLHVAALRREGEYRWSVTHGQHRFALAAAGGLEAVPAQVSSVIRREDAPFWPGVVNGTFTQEGALKFFDRMFEGRPSGVTEKWIESR